jgi:hypothetical protein
MDHQAGVNRLRPEFERKETMKKGLVEVTKDGENIFVHPTTVEAHKKIGWKLVDPEDQVELAKSGLVVAQANANMAGKLVRMFNSKTGETSEVHPSTVESHIRAGWNVIDPGYLKAVVETAEAQIPAEKAVPARKPAQKRG